MAADKTPLGLIVLLAIVGGGAGGAASFFFLRDDKPQARVERGYDDRALREDIASLRDEMRRNRLVAAGTGRETELPPEDLGSDESTIEIERPETPEAVAAAAKKEFVPSRYVESLRGKRFALKDSDALITVLSMQKDKIEPTIAALKKAIEADPSNPDLHAALAAAHVTKLAGGMVSGPAAGPVYMQAIQAYDKAIALEPDHWDARFMKAFTTSMAPEFVGMRPASIRMFEDLVQRQESLPKNNDFRRTYMRLGTLYKDAGNTDKAKEMWKKGLERFPDDRQLREALGVIEKD